MAPIAAAAGSGSTPARARLRRLEVAALCVLVAGFIGIRLWNLTAFCLDSDEIFRVLGTFILAFGWFGFNPGSTLAGTDLRISVVAVNTMLASATGALECEDIRLNCYTGQLEPLPYLR